MTRKRIAGIVVLLVLVLWFWWPLWMSHFYPGGVQGAKEPVDLVFVEQDLGG